MWQPDRGHQHPWVVTQPRGRPAQHNSGCDACGTPSCQEMNAPHSHSGVALGYLWQLFYPDCFYGHSHQWLTPTVSLQVLADDTLWAWTEDHDPWELGKRASGALHVLPVIWKRLLHHQFKLNRNRLNEVPKLYSWLAEILHLHCITQMTCE